MRDKYKMSKIISLLLIFVASSFCEDETKEQEEQRFPPWYPPGSEPSPGQGVSEPDWQFPASQTPPTPRPSNPTVAQCDKAIYHQCNKHVNFSATDLSTALTYLTHFVSMADLPPNTTTHPVCSALNVRRDWKCLSGAQRKRYITAWKALYDSGEIAKLTDLYTRYHTAYTESAEFLPACRYINYQLDFLLEAVDPGIGPMPYVSPWTIGVHPEKSIIWNTFGRGGNCSAGYCAEGGIYDQWDLIPCMKYHWSLRNTIYPWATCELDSNVLNFGLESYALFYFGWLGIHFQPFASAGGFEGQLSYYEAPYHMLWYMWTLSECEVRGIKWQLASRPNITPLSYNIMIGKYNDTTCAAQVPNIAEDMLTGVPDQMILPLFWLGYGKLCTIPDVVIKALVKISAGVPEKLPTAFQRMDPYLLAKHFPYLLNGNTSSLLHNCEEVGNCNRECRPIPKPTFLQETDAGRRLLAKLNADLGDTALLAQQHAYEVWYDLNKYYYCSPYVTP